ncbi:MAG: hypothetical protein Q8882_02865 [Bacillota bacterium]|nr:hypothetical protein [Bacillota bacterium]
MAEASLADTIGSILSDPEANSKIQEIMKSLTGEGSHENNAPQPNLGSVFSGEGMPDLNKIMKLKSAYDKATKANDPRITLLSALRPYLSETRNKNLDMAIKFLNLSKLSSLVKETDLLKELL